jgi:S1-C subfamily serine protease
VTSGIISALGRTGLNIEGYEDFIQTDASINPGNSGGALVTLKGELIGINTAIIGPSGGNVGIGFAVPVNMAHAVMEQLAKYGKVQRGRIGVAIQDITPDLAKAMSIDVNEGAVISQVEPGSPAAAAGLKAGDVIVAVDGHNIRSSSDLRNRIGLARIGDEMVLGILREGKSSTVKVKVGEAPAQASTEEEAAGRLAGAVIQDIGPDSPLKGKTEGVVVAEVERGSPAWNAGLREGDVITTVNRKRIRNFKEFKSAVENGVSVLALNVKRGDSNLFVIVR